MIIDYKSLQFTMFQISDTVRVSALIGESGSPGDWDYISCSGMAQNSYEKTTIEYRLHRVILYESYPLSVQHLLPNQN